MASVNVPGDHDNCDHHDAGRRAEIDGMCCNMKPDHMKTQAGMRSTVVGLQLDSDVHRRLREAQAGIAYAA